MQGMDDDMNPTTITDLADNTGLRPQSITRLLHDHWKRPLHDEQGDYVEEVDVDLATTFLAHLAGEFVLIVQDVEGTEIARRPATREQIIASLDVADTGLILVDEDGDVFHEGADHSMASGELRAAYIEV